MNLRVAPVCAVLLALASGTAPAQSLDTHTVRLDAQGRLLSWITPQDRAYDQVMFMSWDLLLHRIPVDPANGLALYYTHENYDPATLGVFVGPNNPGSKNAMLADAAAAYYAYSGNHAVVDLVTGLLDYHLAHGMTPAGYDWANVPWSTGAGGATTYGTDDHIEGVGVLEPDKIGELGYHGFLRFYELTGDTLYRAAAIHCADALVAHARPGTTTESPWPFRVRAQTGDVVSGEDYCADVIGPIRLFDELIRLGLGDVAGYQATRRLAWDWLMAYPMVSGAWANYFEDIPLQPDQRNLNQYVPGQTVRYLLEHPEADPDWRAHAGGLIAWIEGHFGGTDHGEPGLQYGARVISEQDVYAYKMASHSARFAAINALYAEATGDAAAKEKAYRTLNWCTYMCRDDEVVIEGPAESIANPDCWFTDGHGDYIRNFMVALGAVPEWTPAGESHLVRSSSVVRSVSYTPGAIDYTTFDARATEVLRLAGPPVRVVADGVALPKRLDLAQQGWMFDAARGVLRVRHDAATDVRITLGRAAPGIASLAGAYPNPTSAGATLSLTLTQAADVEFHVVDLQGREVWRAPAQRYAAGHWPLAWDGRGTDGATPNGLYFAVVTVGRRSIVRPVAVVR